MVEINSNLKKLLDIGFGKSGDWVLIEEEPYLNVLNNQVDNNILYSFVVDGCPKYIGKTTQGLMKRMRGYQKPGPTQSTNIKNNLLIKKALQLGKVVELYVFPDKGLMKYGEFQVNLSAGLEDNIVLVLSPEWNSLGVST
jgi:hypothetical protein